MLMRSVCTGVPHSVMVLTATPKCDTNLLQGAASSGAHSLSAGPSLAPRWHLQKCTPHSATWEPLSSSSLSSCTIPLWYHCHCTEEQCAGSQVGLTLDPPARCQSLRFPPWATVELQGQVPAWKRRMQAAKFPMTL